MKYTFAYIWRIKNISTVKSFSVFFSACYNIFYVQYVKQKLIFQHFYACVTYHI